MRHGDGGKRSDRRPGTGYEENHARIWPKPAVEQSGGKCPVCTENLPDCVCYPTEDGPKDDEEKS